MQDEYKRTVIFHGVNAVFKSFPYIPRQDKFDPFFSISNEDIDNFQKWGINLVRLGILWEGLETEPLVYNYTLVQEFEKLINKLGQKGIYTIIDSH